MKKIVAAFFLSICVLMCGCAEISKKVEIPGTITEYLYVEAVNANGVYADDKWIVLPDADKKFRQCDTVRVVYYEEDLIEQEGVATAVNGFTEQYTYEKVIQKTVSIRKADGNQGEPVYDKPVIYLYPEKAMKVSVKVNFNGEIIKTIPEYDNGWNVFAYPQGQICHNQSLYPYLFWEGIAENAVKQTAGFCVKGSDTEKFLTEKLTELGLNETERQDFIDFWLPRMINNPYNTIQFHYEDYTSEAPLEITPKPDSILRVFMSFKAQKGYVEIPLQEIRTFERTGFAVVEWGGTEIK